MDSYMRIVNNLIQNVIAHSHADKIKIALSKKDVYKRQLFALLLAQILFMVTDALLAALFLRSQFFLGRFGHCLLYTSRCV